MGFLDRFLGPTPDYTNSASAVAARQALADYDAGIAEYKACSRPGDGTYERDMAAMDRRRKELLDDVQFHEQSGKYAR